MKLGMAAKVTVQTTPASIRCSLRQPSQQRNIVVEFSGQPGVRTVVLPIGRTRP
jgi:hypothetical protein